MNRMHCDDALNQEYVLGVLDPDQSAGLESHVNHCPACALQIRQYRLHFRNLAGLPPPAVLGGIPSRVLARLPLTPEIGPARSVLVRAVPAQKSTSFVLLSPTTAILFARI